MPLLLLKATPGDVPGLILLVLCNFSVTFSFIQKTLSCNKCRSIRTLLAKRTGLSSVMIFNLGAISEMGCSCNYRAPEMRVAAQFEEWETVTSSPDCTRVVTVPSILWQLVRQKKIDRSNSSRCQKYLKQFTCALWLRFKNFCVQCSVHCELF